MIRRRILYLSGRWSRSHVWDVKLFAWTYATCRCGQFCWYEAKHGIPPRGWPVSKRCERARRKKR